MQWITEAMCGFTMFVSFTCRSEPVANHTSAVQQALLGTSSLFPWWYHEIEQKVYGCSPGISTWRCVESTRQPVFKSPVISLKMALYYASYYAMIKIHTQIFLLASFFTELFQHIWKKYKHKEICFQYPRKVKLGLFCPFWLKVPTVISDIT